MLPEELLRKVRHIEITTRKVVDDVLSGQYRSHFKGQGVQFSEHRVYTPGDDIRHIDWKVSARSRDPLIKKFEEEREVTVFLIVDISGSKTFGSDKKLKVEVAAEIGGMLAYAASHSGDKVGVLLFSEGVDRVIPPKKGRQHVLRVIRELLTFDEKALNKGTHLAGALDAALRIMKQRGVVFVISDFLADGYEIALKRLASKHDVVAISITDEKEEKLPTIGQILFYDPENGNECYVDTTSYLFKKWFSDFRISFESKTSSALKGSKIEILKIRTQDDYGEAVVRFFRARSRRKS